MRARSMFRWTAVLAACAVTAGACSTSSNNKSSSNTSPSGSTAASGSGSRTFPATSKGVTAGTIKIGFSYPDLEALAATGMLNISNGPYEPIIKAIVDDVNQKGGINGRKLQVYTAKYAVLGNDPQIASCTQLTEDDQVFAVLGGYIGPNNLCVTQQHATILVSGYGSGFNQNVLAKTRAPWSTWGASDERSLQALVKVLDQQGALKGHKIAVYAQQTNSKPLVDLTVKSLESAGYKATDTAVMGVSASDVQAFNAQDKIIAQRFKDEGIDVLFLVDSTPTANNWDSVGWHPAVYVPQTSLVTPGAFLGYKVFPKFPIVAGLAAAADPDAGYNTPVMQACRAAYQRETGKVIKTAAQETADGTSSGLAAMTQTCSALAIFVAAAKAAGPNLNQQTFLKGLESIGAISTPAAPVGSLGPNKWDAQDSFQLAKHDPTWTPKSTQSEFIPVGQPVTISG